MARPRHGISYALGANISRPRDDGRAPHQGRNSEMPWRQIEEAKYSADPVFERGSSCDTRRLVERLAAFDSAIWIEELVMWCAEHAWCDIERRPGACQGDY